MSVNSKNNKPQFIFFGTPHYAVYVLEELEKEGLLPSLAVAAPDRPSGRGHKLSPPPAKVWAQKHGIEVFQPEMLDSEASKKLVQAGQSNKLAKLAVVAAYGNIIPQEIIDIFPKGILNVHPSLLPKYRGASPVRSQILADDTNTGVTLMLVDEKLDHGPMLAQKHIKPPYWPMRGSGLSELLFREGGKLLAKTLPHYLYGEVEPREQNHEEATFTSKISKKEGEIDLSDDPYKNLLKIRAFDERPRTYFFTHKGNRVIITDADVEDNELVIKKVVPEGKREISWEKFETIG